MNLVDLSDKKLELDYPCNWEYKLVVYEHIDINDVVKQAVLSRNHKINESKVSSQGKFKSYTLEMLVHNEDDRKEIFNILGKHNDIKMII